MNLRKPQTATPISNFLILKFMKRLFIAVLALVFNTFLFSCANDSIAETEALFENQATEGDDGQVDPEREDDE